MRFFYKQKNQHKLFIALIFIVPFIIYFQTLNFKFVNWDDSYLLKDHGDFFKNPNSIITSFTKDLSLSKDYHEKIFYRPVMLISYVIEYQWAGENPTFYHLTNILLHVLTGYLIYWLLQIIGYSKLKSFLLTLIFLIHPLTVQSVAWIQGRNDILLAIFSFLSIIFLDRYIEKKRVYNLVLHLLMFVFALLTKESAVVLPFIFFLYIYLIKKTPVNRKNNLIIYLIWFLSLSLWFLVRNLFVNYYSGGFYSIVDLGRGLLSYMGKLVFPFDLSPYPIPENVDIYYGIAVVVILVLILFMHRIKDRNKFLFGLVIFLLFSLVTFKKGFTTPSFIETRIYPALLGFLIFAAEIDYGKLVYKYRKIFIIMITAFLSVITLTYTSVYKNPFTHLKFAVSSSPDSWVIRHNLGMEYLKSDMIDSSFYQFNRAWQINPKNSNINAALGVVFERMNLTDSALKYYQRSIQYNPKNLTALNNIGLIYFENKNYDSSFKYFSEGLKIDPEDAQFHFNLANTYFKVGDYEKSKQFYLTAIRLDNQYLPAQRYLYYTYLKLGYEGYNSIWKDFLNKILFLF
ncbi:MAG: tetratricopeptide repeat protein [bacterium]